MKVELKLYKYNTKDDSVKLPDTLLGYRLIKYKPGLFTLRYYNQNPLLVLFWLIISLAKFEIYLLMDDKTIVHTSYVSPKVYRFQFMGKKDIQIGPCWTNENYRNKGIYSKMLFLLLRYYSDIERTIWIYTNLSNIASQKAILKSGFEFSSVVRMSRWTKIIKIQ